MSLAPPISPPATRGSTNNSFRSYCKWRHGGRCSRDGRRAIYRHHTAEQHDDQTPWREPAGEPKRHQTPSRFSPSDRSSVRLLRRAGSRTRQGTTPPRAASSCEGCSGHPDRWMVRTSKPSAARRVVKAMRGGAGLQELPSPLPGLAWGDPTDRRTELIGHASRIKPQCIGTFITNARYWIGPVSGDSSPVSSIRSTKPCFPPSGAFRWNHHGRLRFC
jgi:hypothetical protein